MYLNDFSLVIPQGRERPGGYVEIEHGTQYTLRLRNNHGVNCDARVEVDGKEVGVFRIGAHDSIVLERPSHDTGKFTFYKVNSREGKSIGLRKGDSNLGLISVTFTPEKERVKIPFYYHVYGPYYSGSATFLSWPYTDDSTADSPRGTVTSSYTKGMMPMASEGAERTEIKYDAGGTGLSGESKQDFFSLGTILRAILYIN